jgi:hypothetical protein
MINLLPPETLIASHESDRIRLVNMITISIFVVLLFFTSITLTMRFLQNLQYSKANSNLVSAQERFVDLKDKEGYVYLLKQRLSLIRGLNSDTKKTAILNTVMSLVPSDISLTVISVTRSGGVDLSATTSSLDSFNGFISSLNNKEKSSNLINKVELISMSIGKDNVIRFSLIISPL